MAIISITAAAAASYTILYNENKEENDTKPNQADEIPALTTNYTIISIKQAYDRIYNQTENITIIDVPSGCTCRYDNSHLENAIMIYDKQNLPQGIEELYNTTVDLLFYNDYGRTQVKENDGNYTDSTAIMFCKKMINQTYGEIYFLEGGLSDWKNAGYPYWTD